MAYISVVNSHLVDINSTLKLVWLHTSHLLQKAIYCFILTRRRTAEISVLPTLTAPSTPGNVWLYLQTFEKKSQVNCKLLYRRYDDTDVIGNVCVLLSACEERDSSCSSCHTAPVPCSQELPTTTTTITTTPTTTQAPPEGHIRNVRFV